MSAALMRGGSMAAAPCTSRRQAIAAGAQRAPAPAGTTPHQLMVMGAPRHPLSSSSRPRGVVACRGLFGLGLPELAVIAGVTALIFGPSKLPELGKGLGKTVKSFQTAAKEFETELKAAATEGDEEGDKDTKPSVAEDKQRAQQ
jgi:sec-independent protein translocase protein TatA